MKEYKVNVTTQFKEELKNALYFFPHLLDNEKDEVYLLHIYSERQDYLNQI